jgi:hypothetical protein
MFRTLSLSLLLACSCGLANAQQVGLPPGALPIDDGGLTGTLVSFNGDSLGPPQVIFTVPEGNVFALTAACVFGSSQSELSTGTPSPNLIARGNGCVNYSPGLTIIEGEEFSCAGAHCVVTGILVELTGAAETP